MKKARAMLIRFRSDIASSEITPESVYLDRRRFLAGGAALAGAAMVNAPLAQAESAGSGEMLKGVVPGPAAFQTDEEKTPYKDVTRYNNFYEFGTAKEAPYSYASSLKTSPWTIDVTGECAKPGTIGFEDLMKPHTLEERIYRLRCVEAWSMVVPWVGIPLGDILKRFEPNSRAKYVAFETLVDPEQMPGQKSAILDWPYREGLRMDEAMHPLTIMAVGLYGQVLPNQNGAPLRLVVPWKYGFKSIKSIVAIRFTETEPKTTWNMEGPREYGFYANVNPEVSHPRWDQDRERRIGEFFRRPTLMFNGYADQVAGLYSGMDLRKYY